MNARIQELINQAEDPEHGFVIPEKLVELVVQECILTIQMGITHDGYNTEKYLRSIKHITEIKENFGVKP